MITHPLYAGTYRFGHRQMDPRRKKAGQRDAGRVVVPAEECHAWIPNHCLAYIDGERYERNQRRIADNQFRRHTKGAARNGAALLSGILFCGRCGRRMTVNYPGVRKSPRYHCSTGFVDFRVPPCQNLSGEVLDELVTQKLMEALEPIDARLVTGADERVQLAERRTATAAALAATSANPSV
jgi:hypothetical protein